MLAAFGLGLAAFAQAPAFEVASVKVHEKGGGGTTREMLPDGMRYLNITLGEFLSMAYGIRRYQIAGPDWAVNNASPDRYNIVARVSGNASAEQIRQMLGRCSPSAFICNSTVRRASFRCLR